jgi:hypothetical protein
VTSTHARARQPSEVRAVAVSAHRGITRSL